MSSVQQQCQMILERERANIVKYLQPHNTTHDSYALNPSERQATWLMELKLRSVERALQRLANERFGVCQGCRRPIGAERLLALPFVELCIDCQQQWDKRGSHRFN